MTDQWTDRLSEYLDGDLALPERVALEAHLVECQECATTLADLRAVVMRARSLRATPPATDLWPGIESRIGSRFVRRLTFSYPQLIAASLALLLAGGTGTLWLLPREQATPARVVVQPVPVSAPAGVLPASFADPRYDAAVNDLEGLLAAHRNELDPATVQTIETNLALIDRAIADARAALARDPASAFLNSHLADTMQRKLSLLRDATAVITES